MVVFFRRDSRLTGPRATRLLRSRLRDLGAGPALQMVSLAATWLRMQAREEARRRRRKKNVSCMLPPAWWSLMGAVVAQLEDLVRDTQGVLSYACCLRVYPLYN